LRAKLTELAILGLWREDLKPISRSELRPRTASNSAPSNGDSQAILPGGTCVVFANTVGSWAYDGLNPKQNRVSQNRRVNRQNGSLPNSISHFAMRLNLDNSLFHLLPTCRLSQIFPILIKVPINLIAYGQMFNSMYAENTVVQNCCDQAFLN